MSWRKLLHSLLFLQRIGQTKISDDDLLTMDTHVEEESVVDEEGLMVEHGEVVGETAIVTDNKQLKPTDGPLPERYVSQMPPYVNQLLIASSTSSTLLTPTDMSYSKPANVSPT